MKLDSLGDESISSSSSTGVFIGMSNSDFENVEGSGFKDGRSVYSATGSALSVTAGRVSFLMGFRGPAMVVDTACSSSLVALNQACMSLKNSNCDRAVVAGVNLILTPWVSIQYARAGMTSSDGKCHIFDESANGYSRGEGCVAFILKRTKDAIRDGDKIYAIVRGSAVMQDGKSASLTAPNGLAQINVINHALKDAGLTAEDVSYVEAHGTGTHLGDPIEVEAIATAYCNNNNNSRPLVVSSVKANIGHLEAAAGMAGILSAILALHTHTSPPNANLINLNKNIVKAVKNSNILFSKDSEDIVSRKLSDGVTNSDDFKKQPLFAGVSSFGYSGTIAHVILEEVNVEIRKEIFNSSQVIYFTSFLLFHFILFHFEMYVFYTLY